jgi:hypothetical protein
MAVIYSLDGSVLLEIAGGFSGANLSWASLSGASLSGANLAGANLSGASLAGADLSRADLSGASLSRADLSGASLYGASLYGANLAGANLAGAIIELSQIIHTRVSPEVGAFVGWKKLSEGAIAKLLIPEDAERSNATSRKCRASKAVVLNIWDTHGNLVESGVSQHDDTFIYEVGATVTPPHWNPDWKVECGGGIHYFITRQEAEEY